MPRADPKPSSFVQSTDEEGICNGFFSKSAWPLLHFLWTVEDACPYKKFFVPAACQKPAQIPPAAVLLAAVRFFCNKLQNAHPRPAKLRLRKNPDQDPSRRSPLPVILERSEESWEWAACSRMTDWDFCSAQDDTRGAISKILCAYPGEDKTQKALHSRAFCI